LLQFDGTLYRLYGTSKTAEASVAIIIQDFAIISGNRLFQCQKVSSVHADSRLFILLHDGSGPDDISKKYCGEPVFLHGEMWQI
jgi:hypothetical protein